MKKKTKKPQKTYMVAMQATIVLRPTVYLEVVAESEKKAMNIAKREAKVKGKTAFAQRNRDQYLDECNMELEDSFNGQIDKAKIMAINCGRASQYHSSNECELCKHVEAENKKS